MWNLCLLLKIVQNVCDHNLYPIWGKCLIMFQWDGLYVCAQWNEWMNEKCVYKVCVSRGKKERGFHFIDWTRLGPCMEGKGEEFPMRSAVLLGSKKLLKKDLSGNWERWGEVRNVRPGVGVKLFPPWEFHTHTHTQTGIRNFFTSLVSGAHRSIGMITRLLSDRLFCIKCLHLVFFPSTCAPCNSRQRNTICWGMC